MKNLFIKMTFAFVLGLFSVQSAYASCESEVEYCGSKFKIYCDGTVDVDLADNVYRYKIFILRPNGNNTIIDIYNNENPIHDVFTAPLILYYSERFYQSIMYS